MYRPNSNLNPNTFLSTPHKEYLIYFKNILLATKVLFKVQ